MLSDKSGNEGSQLVNGIKHLQEQRGKARLLAQKVLLYLGETQEDAVMTIVEDGSTAEELRTLAKRVLQSESV